MSHRRVRPGIASGRIDAPPSKSYTHRAVLAAHYRSGRFRIEHPLVAEDTLATLRGVGALGTRSLRRAHAWETRPGERVRAAPTVACGESGTTLRFLLPAAALLDRPVRLEMGPGLGRRPVEHGLAVLRAAGVRIRGGGGPEATWVVHGPMRPVRARLDASESSQFLSGLLLALPTLAAPSTVRREGAIVSEPYVEATLRVLAVHGVAVRRRGRWFEVPAPQAYEGSRFRVPGDASSAAYPWTAAAITGGTVTVRGVDPGWPQADLALLPILRRAGVTVATGRNSVTVTGPANHPIRADLDPCPDLLPLVGVLAASIPGRSILRGAAHATLKESDRRHETVRLAQAMGARARDRGEVLVIEGRRDPRSFSYDGARDHRMVMSAAVGALRGDGPSRIGSAESVGKSYPGFWADLDRLTGAMEPPA